MTRAQSAMEYIITYGWAILIIAIVLGLLFELGVFSGVSAPRAQPGSCQVLRPNGPGTTTLLSLSGLCSGEIPEFVTHFDGTSYAVINTVVLNVPTPSTFTAWVYPTAFNSVSGETVATTGWKQGNPGFEELDLNYLGTSEVDFRLGTEGFPHLSCSASSSPNSISLNQWYFVVGEYNPTTPSNVFVYINGVEEIGGGASCVLVGAGLPEPSIGPMTILGNSIQLEQYFTGSMANVQIYSTALNANQIMQLYLEGIGGTPIYLTKLAAWYPLNGGTQDYGGNGYNLTNAAGLSYPSGWTNGYTSP